MFCNAVSVNPRDIIVADNDVWSSGLDRPALMVRFGEYWDTADWFFAPITCSALDARTGDKWYFQFTPHHHYGYDATETPISYLC